MKQLLVIMVLVGLLAVGMQPAASTALSGIQDAKLVNTLNIYATENLTVTLMHPWTDVIESTTALKLDPGKHYMIILVEIPRS